MAIGRAPHMLATDPLQPTADDWLGWTFTEDRAIFDPVVGFAKEWGAMREPFVVVNIETTGLDPESSETIEIAALLVDPSGPVTSEFSRLVKVTNPVSDDLLKLIGVTQEQLALEGLPLAQVMKEYLEFVALRPVFLQNATVDLPFLKKAAESIGRTLDDSVYDIDYMALMIWTEIQIKGFNALTAHVGASQTRPRSIDDAKATLAVLLAARDVAFSQKGL